MRNFHKQKQTQEHIVNISQLKEIYPNQPSNANRVFGKDITNQVKYLECTERSNGCINLEVDNHQVNSLQNNLVSIKTSYRGLRGKNQSMDDNLLKNFVSKNVRTSNFDLPKEKMSHQPNNQLIHNQPKATREESNFKVNKMELISRVNRLNNTRKDNSSLGVGLAANTTNNNIRHEKDRNIKEIHIHPQFKEISTANIQSQNFLTNNLNTKNNVCINNKNYPQRLLNNNDDIPISSDVHMRTCSPMEEDFIHVINISDDPTKLTQPHEEYLDEIYTNLLQEELTDPIRDYMQFQDQINPKMRVILIEWIIDVSIKFKLKQNTLFLTVHLIDRYLSLRKITRDKYQLLGAGCLFIACKYEEIYFPELRDIIYICDKAFSGNEILKMESEILMALDYKIIPVSPSRFLQIISAQLKLRIRL